MTKEKKPVDFLKYYVEPHKKKSREVTKDDLPQLIKDAHIMYNLCYTQRGNCGGALAIAHQQINKEDPMRVFVTKERKIVINPVMLRHTDNTVDSSEGCLSFPGLPQVTVQRWNKCEVKYLTLTGDGKDFVEKTENIRGKESKVFQHEMDHFECEYIYKT